MGDVENVPEKFNLDFIKRFSSPLCSRDPNVRELALTDIEKSVTDWLRRLPDGDEQYDDEEDGDIVLIENDFSLLTVCLPAILRLSVNCPFQDVRDKFAKLLFLLKVTVCFSFQLCLFLVFFRKRESRCHFSVRMGPASSFPAMR